MTVDHDRTGLIEFPEFVELIEIINEKSDIDQDLRDAFNAFDVDGRGYVSSDDVKSALMEV